MNSTKTRISEKLAIISIGAIVTWSIIYGITWYIDKDFEEEKQFILQNPVKSIGVVVDETSYKGKGATIAYVVGDRELQFKASITYEFYFNTSVGDSVPIVYSKVDPEKAILQYDLDHPKSARLGSTTMSGDYSINCGNFQSGLQVLCRYKDINTTDRYLRDLGMFLDKDALDKCPIEDPAKATSKKGFLRIVREDSL